MCVYMLITIYMYFQSVEMIWKFLILNVFGLKFFHMAKNTWLERFTDSHILQQQDSIGLARDTNAYDILITGDFNLDMTDNRSSKKINDLCQEYNLSQIISEHTRFTENSRSLTDLIMTSNVDDILLSTVGEPFFDQNIRYHCPIFCVLNFEKPKI